MTPRRSRREIARSLDGLDSNDTDDEVVVVWRDERTGELVDEGGEPVDPDPDVFVIELTETVVMGRERAEEEGREILGPAKDAPQENVVRVSEESA